MGLVPKVNNWYLGLNDILHDISSPNGQLLVNGTGPKGQFLVNHTDVE